MSVDTALGGDIKADHVSGHTATAIEEFDDWPMIQFVSHPVAGDDGAGRVRDHGPVLAHAPQVAA